MTWHVEAVKLLATAHLGGLAGAIALATGGKKSSIKVLCLSVPAAAFFIIGLLCVYAFMISQSEVNRQHENEVRDRISNFDKSHPVGRVVSHDDYKALFSPAKKGGSLLDGWEFDGIHERVNPACRSGGTYCSVVTSVSVVLPAPSV